MTSHKGHLYHLFWILDHYVMYRQRAQSCEMCAKVSNWVADPSRWSCESLLFGETPSVV